MIDRMGWLLDNGWVMAVSSLWPFESPSAHEAVSAIIRRRSANGADVREVVLRDLDLSFARNILDLGCGFGFMVEALAGRTAPDAHLVGVDVWPSNEAPFLQHVAAVGRRGSFICMEVDSKLPWPDRSFDLIVCSYSLYFFPGVLPEVVRILAPHGLFLVLTHSENSFVGLLEAAGVLESESELLSLSRMFSAENGAERLCRWFREVTRIDYANALRFETHHADELLIYLRFKLPLLIPGSGPSDEVPETLARFARAWLSRRGHVIVEKNDTAFRCRIPSCH